MEWTAAAGGLSLYYGKNGFEMLTHAKSMLISFMFKTTPEHNKALVLEAFDALFNKRDYTAVERFWSETYIQHSAHIPPGSLPESGGH